MSERRPARPVLAAIVLAVVSSIVWFGFLRNGEVGDGLTAFGTVEATESQLAFQAAGRIQTIDAREGDRVTTGQELASLDRSELNARRAQLVAQLAAARAGLAELQSGFRAEEIAQGRAGLRAAEEQVSDAERDLERTALLHDGGAVSREALEKSELALSLSRIPGRRATGGAGASGGGTPAGEGDGPGRSGGRGRSRDPGPRRHAFLRDDHGAVRRGGDRQAPGTG